jgi:hypothetical protein
MIFLLVKFIPHLIKTIEHEAIMIYHEYFFT